jgi:hypothetical protein
MHMAMWPYVLLLFSPALAIAAANLMGWFATSPIWLAPALGYLSCALPMMAMPSLHRWLTARFDPERHTVLVKNKSDWQHDVLFGLLFGYFGLPPGSAFYRALPLGVYEVPFLLIGAALWWRIVLADRREKAAKAEVQTGRTPPNP